MDLMARILNGSLTRAVAVISGRSLDGLRGQRPTVKENQTKESCSKAGCGRKLRPTNRIYSANWCVGKQVFIIIECNSKRAICMLHVMDSENAGRNI
ncbi:hypothetical protein ALC60_03757 [Trachymyrmex zeteki]|uniref:Uncharacterized protein n=1 Tax=Mycetomoellerius zeteki TaxID=64791 RepID=A0A151XA39_9HYME|nr:hypothetical protein ALC60_03757 [Trachymyrmex zeteki]